MEARLERGSVLKKAFDAIKEMVTDVNLECNSEGMELQAMDASHVSLVALCLKAGIFDVFRCGRSRSLGMNMATVSKGFKLCGNDDAVIIRHHDDSDNVTFVFEGMGTEDGRVSEFSMTLMQLRQDHLGVPEAQFAAVVVMPSKQFAKAISDCGQFSDTINFVVCPKSIKFAAKGDNGKSSILLRPRSAEADRLEIQCEEGVSLQFATRYLAYIVKGASLADSITLRMASKQPLEATYNLRDNGELGHIRYFLAPKVDDEMEEEN